MTDDDRTAAVVLFGGLSVLARHAALIGHAHDRGLAVLVATGGADAAARLAAHRAEPDHPLSGVAAWVVLDSSRVDDVLAAVLAGFAAYRIEAVLSCGEVFVEACGQLADLLGLPGPGLRATRVCRNKQLQRAYLAELSPSSTYLSAAERATAADLAVGYPVVVKPTGRMSSSGVVRVHDPRELAAAVAAAGDGESLLVEELVTGPEYSVEALVRDGTVTWENVTGKVTNEADGRYFTETRHVVPAVGLDAAAERHLLAANRRALSLLDFRTGISHAEFRLTPGRGPVLMEMAARVPGDGITLLLHLATGAPVEPVLLDLALGRSPGYPRPCRRAVHQYLDPPAGVLVDVEVPDGPAPSWVGRTDWWPSPVPLPPEADARTAAVFAWQSPGSRIGPLRDSDDRVASVMLDLPLHQEVEPAVQAARARVVLRLEPVGVRTGGEE